MNKRGSKGWNRARKEGRKNIWKMRSQFAKKWRKMKEDMLNYPNLKNQNKWRTLRLWLKLQLWGGRNWAKKQKKILKGSRRMKKESRSRNVDISKGRKKANAIIWAQDLILRFIRVTILFRWTRLSESIFRWVVLLLTRRRFRASRTMWSKWKEKSWRSKWGRSSRLRSSLTLTEMILLFYDAFRNAFKLIFECIFI